MATQAFNKASELSNEGRLIPSFPMGADETGIVADIGGTNVRLQCVGAGGFEGEPKFYKTADFASFNAVLEKFFEDCPEAQKATALSIGAAGAVENHTVKMTNIKHWPEISADALKTDFPSLRNVCVVNDFVAIANAISALEEGDIEPVEGGQRNPRGNIVVIGPGTGFGLAVIAHDPVTGREIIVPGEAGHNAIKALPKGKLRDITDIVTELGHPGTHNRNVMTGRGLGLIYDALRVLENDRLREKGEVDCTKPSLLEDMNRERGDKPHEHTQPQEVIALAKEGDTPAREALEHFFTFIGRDIGSRIAESTAAGGGYVAGGMIVRCREAFVESEPAFWTHLKTTLRRASEGRGPGNFSGKVGITLVLDELCGLSGLRKTFAFPSGSAPKAAPGAEPEPRTP